MSNLFVFYQCRELVLHQSSKPVPLISVPNKEKEYKTQFESLETDNPCELLAATLAKADNYTLSLDKLCMVSKTSGLLFTLTSIS